MIKTVLAFFLLVAVTNAQQAALSTIQVGPSEDDLYRSHIDLIWELAAKGDPDSSVEKADGTRYEDPTDEWKKAYKQLHGKDWVPRALLSRQELIRAEIMLLRRKIVKLEQELNRLNGVK